MSTNNAINVPLLGHTGTGQFVGDTSPTIVTPEIGQINDTNGNASVSLFPTPSAVNYFTLGNSATLGALTLAAAGTDTDISLSVQAKGAGTTLFNSTGNIPIEFNSGTGYQHFTSFTFPNTAVSRNVTFPDASGTLALTSDISSTAVLLAPSGPQTITGFGLTVPSLQLSTNNALYDSAGNLMVSFLPQANAVNYFLAVNSISGVPPAFGVAGADTNIGITFYTKGIGTLEFATVATSNQIVFSYGAAPELNSYFNFKGTGTGNIYTWRTGSGTVVLDASSSGSITTAPAASSASTLAVGTAYQNTLGYDAVITVYLAVSAATAASILLGVGSTNTPTQQTIVSGLTLAALGIIPVTIYLPTGYYALLSVSGTITQTISGQQAMPV